jgi:hypothetical protein
MSYSRKRAADAAHHHVGFVDLERWFRCRECNARKAAVSVQ